MLTTLAAGLIAGGITAGVAAATHAAVPGRHELLQVLNVLLGVPCLEGVRLARGMQFLPVVTEEMQSWIVVFNTGLGMALWLGLVAVVQGLRRAFKKR